MSYSSELKNNVLSRILAGEIPIAEAHREYGISISTLKHWLRKAREKAGTAAEGGSKISKGHQKAPLPQGMNLSDAILAMGYCQGVGMDSTEAGQYCRAHGIELGNLKEFSEWFREHDQVVPAEQAHDLARELAAANACNKKLNSEVRRKDKALAETAALLVLTKKAKAIWGNGERER